MSAVSGPSARQFACVRIALGAYVAVSFAAWIPHAELLLRTRALLPLPDTHFPNLLDAANSIAALRVLLVGVCAAGLAFAAGFQRRPLGLLLWYAWACLVERLVVLSIPSDGYVGWLLLASTLVPSGESLRTTRASQSWSVPREIALAAWVIVAVSYTASGLDKLGSASWRHGAALGIILQSPIARPFAPSLVHALPAGWWQLATWAALALESGYALLCGFPRLRPWAWLAAVSMHLGVLATMQIESVSLAMLIFHGFLFDPAWVPEMAWRAARARLVRGMLLAPTRPQRGSA